MSEVTELAPGDIDRSGGISTGQSYREDSTGQQNASQQPAAEMTSNQQAGLQKLAEMRARAGDHSLTHEQRELIMKNMSELSRHVFQGTKAPAWFGEAKADPRATSNEPADDGMAETFAAAGEVMTSADKDHLLNHAKAKQLSPADASMAVEFATQAGLDRTTAKVVTDRIAHHASQGYGIGAEISPEFQRELAEECVRSFGGVEKAQAEIAIAAAYLQKVGLLDWIQTHGSSLAYDPQTISMFALKARQAALRPAKL